MLNNIHPRLDKRLRKLRRIHHADAHKTGALDDAHIPGLALGYREKLDTESAKDFCPYQRENLIRRRDTGGQVGAYPECLGRVDY